MKALARSLAGVAALSVASTVFAQDSKSAPLARQLAAALDQAKLDSVAARDPSHPDTFVAALYIPGVQLLVVSARYTAPQLLDPKLTQKNFKDVYIDLN